MKRTTQFLLEDKVVSIVFLTLWLFPVCWWPEGKECPAAPALEEWRVCNDHPCMVFYWEASAWGPCIEDTSMDLNGTSFWNGTRTCAVGVQIRKVTCMKMNVGPVINKRYVLSAVYIWGWQCLLFWYWSVHPLYTYLYMSRQYQTVRCFLEQHCVLTV